MSSFPLFPPQASSTAHLTDGLFFYLVLISAAFAGLIFLLVAVLAVKYRRKSEDERPKAIYGNHLLEAAWTIIPLGLTMTMFAWGADLFFANASPPPDAMEFFVVGKQWMWKIEHPEGAREINELHVPLNRAVKLTMTSEDVIHDFFIPAFRVKMDVIPGRYTSLWFKATKPGKYHMFCAQYCGTSHAAMGGWVHVLEDKEYADWLAGIPVGGGISEPDANAPPAVRGKRLFAQYRCDTCHSSAPTSTGPDLAGIFGSQVKLANGTTVTVDEDYLRESIILPQAKVVAKYQPVMPTFKNELNEGQIMAIISYLKSPENQNRKKE